MKNKIITIAGKRVTDETIEKLDEALSKSNMEQLKKQMEKLFTFKNIYNMHDDHLIELGECIMDLWTTDDEVEWAKSTSDYTRTRTARYQRRKKEKQHKMQWAKTTGNIDEVTMLDLTYQAWVYENGFEYSRFQMYNMLYQITQDILEDARKENKL